MYKENLKFLENEYWYGGIVHIGKKLPVSEKSDITIDLISGKDASDQHSPLFISNKGRYIHSEKPFVITFRNGEIHIEGIGEITVADGFLLSVAQKLSYKDKTQSSRKLFFL